MSYLGNPIIFSLDLKRSDYHEKAYLGYVELPFEVLNAARESFLHPEELRLFNTMSYYRIKLRFLRGRYLAKRLLANQLQIDDLTSILVRAGIFRQPLVNYDEKIPAAVSLSHSDRYSACLVFPCDHPMGIDIEEVKEENIEIMNSQITIYEGGLSSQINEPENVFYTRLWTVKEALSKVLMTGLMTPMSVYQIASVSQFDQYVMTTFSNFGQYKALSFWWKENICAIVLPKETECMFLME